MANKVKFTNRYNQFYSLVKKKNLQYLSSVASYGANESKRFTPIAYGTLRNSQTIQMTGKASASPRVLVAYRTSYAEFLENPKGKMKGWKPKPAPKYGRKGKGQARGYNPKAKEGFLRLGFESRKAKSDIERLKKIFKV